MSQPKLEQDMDIIQQAPLEIQLIGDDMNIISKLDDEPNDVGGLTAAELKAEFDKAGNIIKKYLNEKLVPEILASDATEKDRIAAEEARRKAEAERQTAETARIEAENLRLSAETARIQAETERQEAESTRIQAEEGRVQAEAARVEAENRREDEETGYVAQAAASAKSSESWAVGGTGTRPGEDTNNAKYWSDAAKAIAGGGVTSFKGRGGNVVPEKGDYTAEMVGAVDATEKAAPNGVATLDEAGQVPAEQLRTVVPGVVPAGYQATLEAMLKKLGVTVPAGANVNTYPVLANSMSPKLLPDNLLSDEVARQYGLDPKTATPSMAFAKEILERQKVASNIKFQKVFSNYSSSGTVADGASCSMSIPLYQYAAKYTVLVVHTKLEGELTLPKMSRRDTVSLNSNWNTFAGCLGFGYSYSAYQQLDQTLYGKIAGESTAVLFPMGNSSNPIFGFRTGVQSSGGNEDHGTILGPPADFWYTTDSRPVYTRYQYGNAPIKVEAYLTTRSGVKGTLVTQQIEIFGI